MSLWWLQDRLQAAKEICPVCCLTRKYSPEAPYDGILQTFQSGEVCLVIVIQCFLKILLCWSIFKITVLSHKSKQEQLEVIIFNSTKNK